MENSIKVLFYLIVQEQERGFDSGLILLARIQALWAMFGRA